MTPEPLHSAHRPDDWTAFVGDRADSELQRARDAVAALKDGTPRTPEQALEIWNDGDIGLAQRDVAGQFAGSGAPG